MIFILKEILMKFSKLRRSEKNQITALNYLSKEKKIEYSVFSLF